MRSVEFLLHSNGLACAIIMAVRVRHHRWSIICAPLYKVTLGPASTSIYLIPRRPIRKSIFGSAGHHA